MKLFICLLIACLAVGALAANRPTFEIEPLDWKTITTPVFPFASLASSGDLLVYFDQSSSSASIAVRRRNSEGGYDQVANITQFINTLVRTAYGKWIWIQDGNLALFSIDDDNQLSEASFIYTVGGSMLSNDTFVGYVPGDESPGQIVTFEYQAANNNWTVIEGSELNLDSDIFSNFDMQSYRAYNNHLVVADMTDNSVKLYRRQADKSWNLTDTIPVNRLGSTSLNVHYNGLDTIVFVTMASLSDGSTGAVYLYTKKHGVWHEQFFNTTGVGYIPTGNLGTSCAFINANTLLVSAGTASYYNRAPFQIGKVLMLTRADGGDWTPHIDIVGNGADVFGLSIAVNDYDLVVYDVSIISAPVFRVYTAPLCFAQPLNITCQNTQLDDCSSLASAQIYTINQSPRCGAVTPLLNGVSLVDQKLQAEFTFTRFEIETFSCNATLTCPAPVVPVAVSVPVKAPTARTSGGSMIQCFSLAALSLYLAVF